MLTFELQQKQGQGKQRSRSSTAFYHSSWEADRKQTTICCVESSKLVESCQSMGSFTVLTIHGHRHYVYAVPGKGSYLSFSRDKAKAYCDPDHRLPSSRATGKWQKAD